MFFTHQESTMRKIRPLGPISDFVVEEMPLLLVSEPAHIGSRFEALLACSNTQIESCRTTSNAIALFDLKMIETTIVMSGEKTPDSLRALVNELAADCVPSITYEDIVLINPVRDMRTFTQGKTEKLFYSTHRKIEGLLGTAINIIDRTCISGTVGILDIVRLRRLLSTVLALVSGLQQMPEGHFLSFRSYLSSREDRGTKGPSGAFTARIPALELMYLGSEFPEAEIAYLQDNWKYYPKRDAELLARSIARAREGTGLEDRYASESSVFLLEIMVCLSEFFSQFGSTHYGAVRAQVPEALSKGTLGTAGETDVRTFLSTRARRRNLRAKAEHQRLEALGPLSFSLGSGW